MKTLLFILLVIALRSAKADRQSRDYARFEKWLSRVQEVAPRYHLKLRGTEDEQEWFYLYNWQGNDHSVKRAILEARRAWENERY